MTKRLWIAFGIAVIGLAPMVTVSGPVVRNSHHESFLLLTFYIGLFGVGMFINQYLKSRGDNGHHR